jgi:hypothetical protein
MDLNKRKISNNRMNLVAVIENLLKQVGLCPDNVFPTRFAYQAANSFAEILKGRNPYAGKS